MFFRFIIIYYYYVVDVILLLLFYNSFSQGGELAGSVRLWYFFFILTFWNTKIDSTQQYIILSCHMRFEMIQKI